MRKINLGCGSNILEGWENHDMDMDLTQPLPFDTGSVDFIFAEHVVEHLTLQEAYRFFEECHRVLVMDGIMRIIVPDPVKIFTLQTSQYRKFLCSHGWGEDGVKSIVFNHGHKSAWTGELLITVLGNIGFLAYHARLYKSDFEELNGIDGHWRVIGAAINDIESVAVEAIK